MHTTIGPCEVIKIGRRVRFTGDKKDFTGTVTGTYTELASDLIHTGYLVNLDPEFREWLHKGELWISTIPVHRDNVTPVYECDGPCTAALMPGEVCDLCGKVCPE